MTFVDRKLYEIQDFLKYNGEFRNFTSHIIELRERFRSIEDTNSAAESLVQLTKAARLAYRQRSLGSLEKAMLAVLDLWTPRGFDWNRFFPHSEPKIIQKGIILKAPRDGEKGVLFVAFEDHWLRLLRYADVPALARDYELILSPTWSPPHDLAFMIAVAMWPGRFFTILSNFDDVPAFRRLSPSVIPIPLLASSWVNPDTFATPNPPPKKIYDFVMLANTANYKRHFAFFRALAKMPGKTALLLGHSSEGRDKDTILNEARWYGVEDRVTFKQGLPDAEMIEAMHASKVGVIMSLTEGSCVAVNECMFADLPMAMLETANVGSLAYINEHTGVRMKAADIAGGLLKLLNDHDKYHPRKWMLENGSACEASFRILNEAVKETAKKDGKSWTRDLKPMQWRPNSEFLRAEDAHEMKPEYDRFAQAYGIPIALRNVPQ